jgi:hypothetical protein
MEAVIVNILIAGFLLLFGAMAIVPMFIGNDHQVAHTANGGGEDRVLRVEHKAILHIRAGENEPVIIPVHQHIDRPAA